MSSIKPESPTITRHLRETKEIVSEVRAGGEIAPTPISSASSIITNSTYLSSNNSTIMAESAFQQPVNMSSNSNNSLNSSAISAISVTSSTSLSSSLASSSASSSGSSASPSLASPMAGATVTTSSTTTTTRNNISVTNIKCEIDELSSPNGNIVPVLTTHGINYFNGTSSGGGIVNASNNSVNNINNSCNNLSNGSNSTSTVISGGVRIPVPKTEDSDSEAELTNIENLKVRRRAAASSAMDSAEAMGHSKNGPRPMSWEGELSESETHESEFMETENSLSNGPMNMSNNSANSNPGVAVIKSEATTTTPAHLDVQATQLHHLHGISGLSHSIKSELEQICNNGLYSYASHGKLKLGPTQSDPINLKYEPQDASSVNSPLLARSKTTNLPLPANPSPDSAIHSVYTHSSPSQSPLTSRHAPYTPSLSRNNSDASHSSCYSYSSEFSPTHSPIQGRHAPPTTPSSLYGPFSSSGVSQTILYRPMAVEGGLGISVEAQNLTIDTKPLFHNVSSGGGDNNSLPSSPAGISRQQLINSPCPICGDKISGFHYGIFSCESCKGFFKRTVQNRKNYVCVRGGPCPVSIATRKKCPACRFDKCLQKGMKLEAIREDRTRGGRSTYQCSYNLPNSILNPMLSPEQAVNSPQQNPQQQQAQQYQIPNNLQHSAAQVQGQAQRFANHTLTSSSMQPNLMNGFGTNNAPGVISCHSIKTEQDNSMHSSIGSPSNRPPSPPTIPPLLQEIMDVEHLWQYNEVELARLNKPFPATSSSTSGNNASSSSSSSSNQVTNTLLVSAGLSSNSENANPDWIAHLCNVADHRLYKIVKWCKSLPLFKNISIDDQIRLLINSWCELLLFSCCFRSIDTPGEIKLSQGKTITLAQAKSSGLQACIERMLNLTDHLRRLRVDRYEYVAMKVIVLLQSDTELQEPVKVRECQEKALQSLQAYTHSHYPDTQSKFGELLLRIPDLQRTYQLGKDMLTIKSRDGGGSDFNLLMELLRGEH